MKCGTVIRLPDGRVGTIVWHHLDGYGGVWGEHDFSHVDLSQGGFTDGLPSPQFMLREPSQYVMRFWHDNGVEIECVGAEYEVVEG